MFKHGESYLIFENNFDRVFAQFSELLNPKTKGLVVWRVHPQKEDAYIKGKDIRTKWITNINTSEAHLAPQDIEQLSYDLEHFMKDNFGGAVLLLCVEYLISFNSFQDVLHLIQTIHDFAAEYGCVFIVQVSKGTLEKQQENLLRQELIVAGDANETN
ncbi:DUF835 domain-containing protein [Candidatus Woesearchaeota archaeon]|nr:DUF835 domain-containing protein [Candidatus Woesearchaeota archaeon]